MKIRKQATGELGISDLAEAEWNPRIIGEAAMAGLKASVKEFGDISGITFNRRMGVLVSGHQRLKALKEEFGVENLRTEIVRDVDGTVVAMTIITPNSKRFNVRIVDWDDATTIAANLAANNELIQGEWTDEAGALVDRVSREVPLIARSTRVDELFIPDVERPTSGDLADTEKLKGEDQPENKTLDPNYFYVEFYGQPERFANIRARLKLLGIFNQPHEVDRDWFEKFIYGLVPTAAKKAPPQKKKG